MSSITRPGWITDPIDGRVFSYDARTDTLNSPSGQRTSRPQGYPRECFRDGQTFLRFLESQTPPSPWSQGQPPDPDRSYSLVGGRRPGAPTTQEPRSVPSYGHPRTTNGGEPVNTFRRLSLSQDTQSEQSLRQAVRVTADQQIIGRSRLQVQRQGRNSVASGRPEGLPLQTTVNGMISSSYATQQVQIAPAGYSPISRTLLGFQAPQSWLETRSRDWAPHVLENDIGPGSRAPPDFSLYQQSEHVLQPPSNQSGTARPNESDIVNRHDPVNGVRALFQLNPAEEITDPALLRHGIVADRKLLATGKTGESETLFPGFKVRKNPRDFFTIGKVFLVLWVQPAGETGTVVSQEMEGVLPGRYGQKVFSKVRRFVVIREGLAYCSALPIATYGRQGVGKVGVNKADHGVIFTGSHAPAPLPIEYPQLGEAGMRPLAIRVVPHKPTDKLDVLSRIDYGKVHTIEHNIKVKSLGNVHVNYVDSLKRQFFEVWSTAMHSNTHASATGASSSRGNQDTGAPPALRSHDPVPRGHSTRSTDRSLQASRPTGSQAMRRQGPSRDTSRSGGNGNSYVRIQGGSEAVQSEDEE